METSPLPIKKPPPSTNLLLLEAHDRTPKTNLDREEEHELSSKSYLSGEFRAFLEDCAATAASSR